MAEKRKMDQMQAYIIMTVNGNIYFGQVSKKQQSFVQKKKTSKKTTRILKKNVDVCMQYVVSLW